MRRENKPAESSAQHPHDVNKTQLASPEAAARMRRNSEYILSIWTRRTRRHGGPAQASADTSMLRDSLPELLGNLANALENPDWDYGSARNDDLAREHGRQRHRANICNVSEMIDEYAMLRCVVVEVMQCEPACPSDIIARIHAFVDAAIRTATREFVGLENKQELHRIEQQRDDSNRKAIAAQVELRQAQQELDDANVENEASRSSVASLLEQREVRERVVALLSHDLRSPLSSIIVNAQRLERKPGEAEFTTSIASRIIRAGTRIDRMLQDMLDASRLRAGKGVPIAPAACDLAQIAAEAQQDYALAGGAQVKLKAVAPACGVWDRNALRRVIDNLVSNAIKYGTRNADVVIEVVDSGDRARLAVHNQGGTLTEAEIAGLFDPYVRTNSAEAGGQVGWGLGLTLVHGVAKAHGGEVGASCSAACGTTFWFDLPKS